MTTDGTVGPILTEGGNGAPSSLVAFAGQQGVPPERVSLDGMPDHVLADVIASQFSRTRWSRGNRHIPGVHIRDNAGIGVMPEVEYTDPENLVNGRYELHVRSSEPAARNLARARHYAASLGAGGLHQHVVGRRRALSGMGRISVLVFHTLINTLAEISFIEQGIPLVSNGNSFDYMNQQQVERVYAMLGAGSYSREDRNETKLMAVAYLPPGFYDEADLHGFENRVAGQSLLAATISARLESAVQEGRYVSDSTVNNWVRAQGGNTADAIANLHYRRPMTARRLQIAGARLRIGPRATAALQSAGTQYAAGMLVHDWANSPIPTDAAIEANLLGAQQSAIDALERGVSVPAAVAQFVQASGLKRLVLSAID